MARPPDRSVAWSHGAGERPEATGPRGGTTVIRTIRFCHLDRRGATTPGSTWATQHERALERYGFMTTDDAHGAGVDPTYLRLMAQRGTIEHASYGLYRFPQIPVTERTHLMEAVLWAGDGAVLSHDTVLSMHGLANANPSIIRITTPNRVRKTHPPSDSRGR